MADIDSAFAEFERAGVVNAGTAPRSTPRGTREFAFFDPDRNGLTFYVPVRWCAPRRHHKGGTGHGENPLQER